MFCPKITRYTIYRTLLQTGHLVERNKQQKSGLSVDINNQRDNRSQSASDCAVIPLQLWLKPEWVTIIINNPLVWFRRCAGKWMNAGALSHAHTHTLFCLQPDFISAIVSVLSATRITAQSRWRMPFSSVMFTVFAILTCHLGYALMSGKHKVQLVVNPSPS